MASISEDTGEETPLQVYHLDHLRSPQCVEEG